MALQFDSGAYGRAFQQGEENRLANENQPLETMQMLGQAVSGYQKGVNQRQQNDQAKKLYELQLDEAQRKKKEAQYLDTPLNEQLLSTSQLSGEVAPQSLLDKYQAPMGQGEAAMPQQRRSLIDEFRSGSWKSRLNQPPQVDMSSQALAQPDWAAYGMTPEMARMTPRQMESIGKHKKLFADAGQSDFYTPEQFNAIKTGDTGKISEQFGGKIPKSAATMSTSLSNQEQSRTIKTTKEDEDRIAGIRKEITGSKSYQGWLDIKNASDNLQNAASNPTAKRSLGAIYSYVKALDPGSVVREGEISLSQQARSGFERVEGYFNRLTKGQVLNPDEINEMAEWALEKEQLARQTAVASSQPAINQAKRRGYDLTEINEDLFGSPKKASGKKVGRFIVEEE